MSDTFLSTAVDIRQMLTPILIIPDNEPITTTLTPKQVAELLPSIHIYLDPHNPIVALLPAVSVSYKGLVHALRWREADIAEHHDMQRDLTECIEMYQALAFLGNNPDSDVLQLLEDTIQAEIERGLDLEEVQAIWGLRYYPFTDRFIKSMLRRLVHEYESMVEEKTDFHGRTSADAEIGELAAEAASIFEWIDKEKELRERFKCLQTSMRLREMQAKRERRMAVVLGRYSPQSQVPVVIRQAKPIDVRRVYPRLVTILK